ncbi:hypothetical protein DFH28DRAFT_890622 [Melampsora americana]|nr:hypothetical protein DFH28DRAFT_890622 [Melampsora americana]
MFALTWGYKHPDFNSCYSYWTGQPDFAVVLSNPNGLHYQCTVCGGQSMKDYRKHQKSQIHKGKVEHIK